MASPQRENGHVDIANEIVEALAKTHLPGSETQILFAILRKTYGWHKKTDRISITQFEQMTGLKRRHVSRALSNLVAKKIVTKNDTSFVTVYGFQKDYSRWQLSPKMTDSVKNGDETITKNGAHKRKKEKEHSVFSKFQKTKPASRVKDPRIKNIISYFLEAAFLIKGFRPEIAGGHDAKVVQRLLRKYPEDVLRSMIDFYLDSKKSEEIGITLSTALSAHSINLYHQTWGKRKWQYGINPDDTPPTDQKWWT